MGSEYRDLIVTQSSPNYGREGLLVSWFSLQGLLDFVHGWFDESRGRT